MKAYFCLAFFGAMLLASCQKVTDKSDNTLNESQLIKTSDMNFYDFSVDRLEGGTFDFSELKGKKVLIVNTASECGLTPQYEQLQELYVAFKAKDFTIVGFPANNFGGQEPGSNAEIANFCKRNYGVGFPMMAKISVKGSDQHPLYSYLTQKELNGVQDSEVEWNFQKYLINADGTLHKVLSPRTSPLDEEIIQWIEE